MKDGKTIIVGMDSSKRCTGVALISHYKDKDLDVFEIIDKTSIKTKLVKGSHLFASELESYNAIGVFLAKYINIVDYAAFEGFAFGGQGLTGLSGTAAVYQLYFAQQGKPVVHIAPTRVKKIITDKGKAEKEEVQAALIKFITNIKGITFNTYDESDACGIAISSAIINLYPERFPKPVKKIRKPKVGVVTND